MCDQEKQSTVEHEALGYTQVQLLVTNVLWWQEQVGEWASDARYLATGLLGLCTDCQDCEHV